MSDLKLELGCGNDPLPGCIGMDRIDYGQAIVRSFERGIPYSDDTFDEVYSHHAFEHIDKRDVKFVWEEVYRVLKNQGNFILIVPHDRSPQASMPEHLSYWNTQVIEVLCNIWGSPDHHTRTKFEILENQIEGEELHVVLRVIK